MLVVVEGAGRPRYGYECEGGERPERSLPGSRAGEPGPGIAAAATERAPERTIPESGATSAAPKVRQATQA